MSKPSFYDKLTDEEKKEYDQKINSATKQVKESYVSANSELWKKFLEGEARLTDFARSSKSASSKYQYFFNRNGKTCFQYKSFVKDLLEAIGLAEGLSSQRKSMMRYELVKFLQPQKYSRTGDRGGVGVEVKPSPAEELNAVARAKEAEKKAKRVADNLNKTAVAKELNKAVKKEPISMLAQANSLTGMAERTPDGKKWLCPFNSNDPKSDQWLLDRPQIDVELVVFADDR